MLKIIKYSITLIIFSIIVSLFTLYFYLLKGLSIENINYDFINIDKLYIKIDKKIILKAQNININYKSDEKSNNEPLNFKKINSLTLKSIHALEFFQIIDLKNISINNNKINFIKLKQNMLSIDTKDIFFKTLITPKKHSIILRTYNLDIKPINLNIKNIYTVWKFSPYQILIKSEFIYKDSKAKLDLTITKNKRMFYEGDINHISKNTLNSILAKELSKINTLNISNIYIHGNKENVYFKIIDTKVNNKENKIFIPLINGNFNIYRNSILISNKNIFLKIKENNIKLNNTKLYYYLNNKTATIKNKNIHISNKNNHLNIDLNNNKIFYNKLVTITSKRIDLEQNKTKVQINNIKSQYLIQQKQLYSYIPYITIKYNKVKSFIKNIVLVYNEKILKANIDIINANIEKSNISIKNIIAIYKNNFIDANVNKIYLNTPEANGEIKNNHLIYNLKNKTINITNNNALLNYLNIKNIKLTNIHTFIDLNKKKISTNIPNSTIDDIKISKININLENNIFKVIFNTQALLSQKLTTLLKNFKINIPIYQAYGKNDIAAKIKYNLVNSKINTHIKIKLNNSRIVLSKNSHIDIDYSNLELNNSNIILHKTLLEYNQSIVNVKYLINNGLINLDKSYITTNGIFKDLNITNIVELKDYPEQVNIDLKGIDIFLKNLKTNILIHKNIIVNINKLSKFYPYISYLKDYKLNDGNITVVIANDINITSHITKTNQTILEKHLKPLKKIDINTTISGNKFHIYNNDLDFNITNDINLTTISGNYKDLDINVTQFIDKNESNSSSDINISAHIKAKNSYIRYNNIKLYSNKLSIDYNNTNTKLISIYKDRNITLTYNNGNLKLYALNIREKTFKDITNTNILYKPNINAFIIKNKNSDIIHGFIDIKKGYIKELKALTNIVAFINLIPSLVTFQAVGFSTKGYKIKKGHVEFMFCNNIVYLRKIYIKGINMTFKGNGIVNLNTKQLDLNVDVILMVKLLNDIPIVNYILFGKNNGLTLKINLKGDMTDPKVAPNVTKNILSGPLNIIKRTLLTPFRPFMEEK